MGKKSDEIAREIARKRGEIGTRIEELQDRMREDVDAVKSDAKERSASALDDAKGTLKLDSVKQVLEDHTLTTMAGAVGMGVLLGMASEGIMSRGGNDDRNGRSGNGYRPNDNRNSIGGLGNMLGSFIAPAASMAQNELEDLVREGFATLKGQVRQAGHDDRRVENRDVGVE